METDQFSEAEQPICTLTVYEKATRKKFVEEYLKDYDAMKACMRIGYTALFAPDMARRFMIEPYTLRLISEVEGGSDDGEFDEEKEKRRIYKALWREANNMGINSSQSARVAALAKLTAVLGMDAPSRSRISIEEGGGLFVVPGIMNEQQWTEQAAKQQEELVRVPPQLRVVN